MSAGKKLLVVAEELNNMVDDAYITAEQDNSNKAQLLSLALNGVHVSMINVLLQIKSIIEIENGNS